MALPAPTTFPVSRSRSSTFVDCVDESTPATNGMSATLPRARAPEPYLATAERADVPSAECDGGSTPG